MEAQNTARLYFSNKQAKDGYIKNAVRSLTWRKITANALQALGIEYGTITQGLGLYKGGAEPSMQIFILGIEQQTAVKLAQNIRTAFNQDSVMLDYNGAISFIEA